MPDEPRPTAAPDVPADPSAPRSTGRTVLVPVHRRVNFRSFFVTGALVGAVLGLVYGVYSPASETYTSSSTTIYCGAIGALLGLLVGAVVALVLDRRG